MDTTALSNPEMKINIEWKYAYGNFVAAIARRDDDDASVALSARMKVSI